MFSRASLRMVHQRGCMSRVMGEGGGGLVLSNLDIGSVALHF